MATIRSESAIPTAFQINPVGGTVDIHEIGGVSPPTSIIGVDQDWEVKFHWEADGMLKACLPKTWKLQVFLEKMGSGEGPDLPTKDVPAYTDGIHYVYDEVIAVLRGTVLAGLYQVTAAITFLDIADHPVPVAGLADLGLVQFFTPHP